MIKSVADFDVYLQDPPAQQLFSNKSEVADSN